jgi:hypothetical protein
MDGRRSLKTPQMQGARRERVPAEGGAEAYDLYAAGRREERNAADEAFSTTCSHPTALRGRLQEYRADVAQRLTVHPG